MFVNKEESQLFISEEISKILDDVAEEYSNKITIEVFIEGIRKIKTLLGKENFEKFINNLDDLNIGWSYVEAQENGF